eukprot:TRINITY_DN97007_c0_g1_i1.p1 TRINITY_DN97007_c0_g1~~TRINITY_DN97007_c0_g1_i1.p1  ORF type:complete len:391 (+),score=60.94 TRINITY_DN97007_c0_g1_i1:51-1223(+)
MMSHMNTFRSGHAQIPRWGKPPGVFDTSYDVEVCRLQLLHPPCLPGRLNAYSMQTPFLPGHDLCLPGLDLWWETSGPDLRRKPPGLDTCAMQKMDEEPAYVYPCSVPCELSYGHPKSCHLPMAQDPSTLSYPSAVLCPATDTPAAILQAAPQRSRKPQLERHGNQVIWYVDASLLRSKNCRKVSPPFDVSEEVVAQLVVTARPVSQRQHGRNFKASGGKGSIELKCANRASMSFRFGLVGELQEPETNNSIVWKLPEGKDELNFQNAVDEASQQFAIVLEILPIEAVTASSAALAQEVVSELLLTSGHHAVELAPPVGSEPSSEDSQHVDAGNELRHSPCSQLSLTACTAAAAAHAPTTPSEGEKLMEERQRPNYGSMVDITNFEQQSTF